MDIFSALADPTRLKIVEMLAKNGSLPVAKIKEPFDMSAPAVSQHLKALLEAGLLKVEKKAQSRIYSVNNERIDDVYEWAERMKAGLSPKINLAGLRRHQRAQHDYKKPVMASEGGALLNFLSARAR